MDFIRAQIQRIQQQLGGLSLSQKMLAASLVAIMVLTVLFWGKYAATAETVPVLDQPFSAEQATRVVAELNNQGIKATVGSDLRVMVSADRRMNAMAVLAYNRMLPANSAGSVDKIVGQMTLWDSSAKTDKLWNEKKEFYLAQTIALFPGVQEASVHIDPAERRSFSQPSQPRAAINIRMRDGERPGKQLVLAAADTVVGAQSGLTRGNVKVVIDGISHSLPDMEPGGGLGATEILGQKQEWEKHFVNKIQTALANIPNPMIGVAIELKTQRIEEKVTAVDPKNVISQPKETLEQKDDSTMPAPAATDTGAIPNVAPATSGQANGGSTSSATEKSTFENDYGKSWKTINTPPGDASVTSASVRLPRSYFVAVYKQLNPKVTDIDEAALAAMISGELDKIRRQVMACTGLKDQASVMVDFYVDAGVMMGEGGIAGGSSAGAGVPGIGLVGSYGKEVAIGVLALAALFMVSGIVKKGAGSVPAMIALQVEEEKSELERLVGGDEVVGAAGDGSATLEALELDEETSATQEMVSQVSNMVKQNPDAATSLVKRWMNRV